MLIACIFGILLFFRCLSKVIKATICQRDEKRKPIKGVLRAYEHRRFSTGQRFSFCVPRDEDAKLAVIGCAMIAWKECHG